MASELQCEKSKKENQRMSERANFFSDTSTGKNPAYRGRSTWPLTLPTLDVIYFLNVDWNIARQRLQQVLPRFAKRRRVFFIQKPVFGAASAFLDIQPAGDSLWRIIPNLPAGLGAAEEEALKRDLVKFLFSQMKISYFVRIELNPTEAEHPEVRILSAA